VPLPILASIPSPSESYIEIAGRRLTAYGLMIALGVLAAIELSRKRWRDRGGNPEDIGTIAIWAVPAGLIGARLYHVITDWNRLYADAPGDAIKVWEGGLGIPGGILCGVAVGLLVGRRLGINLPVGLDMVAPALPLAQAIGRVGNWWNQELYGRPTDLPWGVEIAPEHRETGYDAFATFHPTFLYELLWNLALCGFLLWFDRKRAIRPGRLFVLYVMGYGFGRLWVEALRIDTASRIGPLRVNEWMSIVLIGGSVLFLLLRGFMRRPGDTDDPYTDGHRWEGREVPADADQAGDSDAAADPDGAIDEAETEADDREGAAAEPDAARDDGGGDDADEEAVNQP
jgi:prolipoprotein diacylglyceryl transferase